MIGWNGTWIKPVTQIKTQCWVKFKGMSVLCDADVYVYDTSQSFQINTKWDAFMHDMKCSATKTTKY